MRQRDREGYFLFKHRLSDITDILRCLRAFAAVRKLDENSYQLSPFYNQQEGKSGPVSQQRSYQDRFLNDDDRREMVKTTSGKDL